MKTHLVSYATEEYRESQKLLAHSAIKFGVDVIWSFSREHLVSTKFYSEYPEILDSKRGAGYWLWKPYLLVSTMKRLDEGEFLIYSDAGIYIIGDLSQLTDLCIEKGGILLFHAHYDDYGAPGPCINRRWTKRDCFIKMGCDSPEYWEARHVDASFQIYQKNSLAIEFLDEYLYWCSDSEVLVDSPETSSAANLAGFLSHRDDQSVLSILSVKYKLENFRHPSQFGSHLKLPDYRITGEPLLRPYSDQPYTNSPYPTLLFHHRNK